MNETGSIRIPSLSLSALFLLALLLGSCQSYFGEDRIEVDSTPKGARVHVDGKIRGTTDLDFRRPYYGTMQITVSRDPYLPGLQYFEPRSLRVSLDEPASPWIFPFDLAFEAVARAFWYENPRIRVDLPSRKVRLESDAATKRELEKAAKAATLAR